MTNIPNDTLLLCHHSKLRNFGAGRFLHRETDKTMQIQFFDHAYASLGLQSVRELKKSPMQDLVRRTLTMLTMVGVAALIGSSSRVSAHCHKLANFLPFLQHILTILPAVET